MRKVPSCRYFLDPTKIILVVSEKNVLWVKAFFRFIGLRVARRRYYIGGIIGDREADTYCLGYKVSI